MQNELLPIGSVVLLKDSTKKVMINGVCQKSIGEQERIWDYCGVVFPEGYISADKVFLFNNEQIERVYMLGYQDEEQLIFKGKAEELLNSLREGK